MILYNGRCSRGLGCVLVKERSAASGLQRTGGGVILLMLKEAVNDS